MQLTYPSCVHPLGLFECAIQQFHLIQTRLAEDCVTLRLSNGFWSENPDYFFTQLIDQVWSGCNDVE